MPAKRTFLLPDLGEGLTEADLLSWSVAVGDTVTLNQVIAEVETAKASVELPSPYAGTVLALHAEEGMTVDVGSPFIDIQVETDAENPETAPIPEDGPAERTPVLVGYGVAADTASKRRRRGSPSASPAPPQVQKTFPPAAASTGPPLRPLAAPPVRYTARQHGVNLADVAPTGPNGHITRSDLEAHLNGRPGTDDQERTPAGNVPQPGARPVAHDEERFPIKGVRKHTAAAMVRSAFTAPHVTEFVDVDVTETMVLIGRLRETKSFNGVRLTPLALIAKALLVALRSNRPLNSFWDEEAQEIVVKRTVNLGIAAATPRGLMVPNIKSAQSLSLRELAIELSDLTTTAKEGKTGAEALADGTITITNIGVFGIDAGTPIINPGEAAILCFGAVRKRPWEHKGEIALRDITTLSLSFDHRLVDGEQGSKFLSAMADALSDPLNLIAMS